MGRIFVMGDLHGAYHALKQCLIRSTFDFEQDTLIFLGDVCDGWPDTHKCIEELIQVKNFIFILGNHDWWFAEWLKNGVINDLWYSQGGKETLDSYPGRQVPETHKRFMHSAVLYYQDNDRLFVHAGIDPKVPLADQSAATLLWDRTFVKTVIHYAGDESKHFTNFREVFLGHTPISGGKPIQCGEVWLMDTAAGWSGVLSLMNVESKETFTSDPVPSLYPGVKGREKKF